MPYCEKCGNQVSENSVFCSTCGQKRNTTININNAQQFTTNATNYNSVNTTMNNDVLSVLCNKIQTQAIVWIVIASVQVLFVLLNFANNDIISALCILAVAVVNFISSKKDFDYIKEIKEKPFGIVEKYKPLGGYIFTLIYNIIFGGVIGVVGSIFCFLTRSYVLNNEVALNEIEKQHINNTTEAPVFGNQWKCQRCGNINYHNVTTCKCGQQKTEN